MPMFFKTTHNWVRTLCSDILVALCPGRSSRKSHNRPKSDNPSAGWNRLCVGHMMCELTSPLSHYVARITALRLQITVMRILKIFAKNSSSPDAKGRSTTDSLSWDLALAVAVEARSLSHTERSRCCLLSLFLYFNMHCTVSILFLQRKMFTKYWL